MDGNGQKKLTAIMKQGVRDHVFPGAVLLVSRGGEVVFFRAVGHRSRSPSVLPVKRDSVFDLASLTKPLATAAAAMKLRGEGVLDLDQPLGEILPPPLEEKKELTSRLLLSHSAGFADWKPFYRDLVQYPIQERKTALRKRLVEEPLVYPPGQSCCYSDLGYMVLEWVIESLSERSMQAFLDETVYGPLGLKGMFLAEPDRVANRPKEEFVATEACSWRNRVIQGEVHDENAHALGGYSGHAGLFGRAADVHRFADQLMGHYHGKRETVFSTAAVREFFARQQHLSECTWALGWDTPSAEGSSSGKHFSPESVGHLGFTGTSVWMDLREKVIVILLTNRIHPTRDNEQIRSFRPRLHDAVMENLGLG